MRLRKKQRMRKEGKKEKEEEDREEEIADSIPGEAVLLAYFER